jgi:hypothetical protein
VIRRGTQNEEVINMHGSPASGKWDGNAWRKLEGRLGPSGAHEEVRRQQAVCRMVRSEESNPVRRKLNLKGK